MWSILRRGMVGNLVLVECGKLLSSGKNNSSGHKYQNTWSFWCINQGEGSKQ